MRFLSLLLTVLVVAYLVWRQLAPEAQSEPAAVPAKARAAAVEAQVQAQFEQQQATLSRLETGTDSASEATSEPAP